MTQLSVLGSRLAVMCKPRPLYHIFPRFVEASTFDFLCGNISISLCAYQRGEDCGLHSIKYVIIMQIPLFII